MPHSPLKEIAPQIAARVREVCKGLKVQKVAELTGGNRETVRRYLHGESEPSAAFLAQLCRGLHLSPNWLLLGIGQPHQDVETKPQDDRHAPHDIVRSLVKELARHVDQFDGRGNA